MTKRIRMGMALAVLALALPATGASASRIAGDDQTFRIIWSELTFAYNSGERVTCPVTLAGRYNSRTISKIAHGVIGTVTAAAVGACDRTGATVLAETLPWDVAYESFSGALPNITEFTIAILNMSFQVRGGAGQICLARTTTTEPALFTAVRTGTAVTRFTPTAAGIDMTDTTQTGCDLFGFDISLAGTGTVTDSAGEALNVTLI